MSGNRTQQTQVERKQHLGIPLTGQQAEQDTWEGGGREPVHPDDVGDNGEYLGRDNPKQQLRSDDN